MFVRPLCESKDLDIRRTSARLFTGVDLTLQVPAHLLDTRRTSARHFPRLQRSPRVRPIRGQSTSSSPPLSTQNQRSSCQMLALTACSSFLPRGPDLLPRIEAALVICLATFCICLSLSAVFHLQGLFCARTAFATAQWPRATRTKNYMHSTTF